MRFAVARDLRQVRDAQHLARARKLPKLAPDDVGDAPADAGVDLVEHECRDGRCAGARDLDGEADARQLASGRDLGERRERQAGVQLDLELDALEPRRVGALDGLLLELDAELAVRHAELDEQSS